MRGFFMLLRHYRDFFVVCRTLVISVYSSKHMSQEANKNRFKTGGKHHHNMQEGSKDKVRKWCSGCEQKKKVFPKNTLCPDCGGVLSSA